MVEQRATALTAPKARATCGSQDTEPETIAVADQQETVEIKLARTYVTLREERANQQNAKPISARELARPANVRRLTSSERLQQYGEVQETESASPDHELGADQKEVE